MRSRAWLVLVAALSAACASRGEPDIATLASNSDQVIWEAGMKAFDKKNWDSARQHFKRIIDGFPQSEYGPAARIALGDSYFNERNTASYILAISAYRDFLTLYPSHPRADYAQFRVAESYFAQRNGPDRDQTATNDALREYEQMLDLYPNSSYVEQTRERVHECRQSLARASYLVGYFYQHTRRAYRAAISRFEAVVKQYPDYDELDEVLIRLAECLDAAGREAEALPYLDRLVRDYPKSEHLADAQELMATVRAKVPAAPPSPAPAQPPGSP